VGYHVSALNFQLFKEVFQINNTYDNLEKPVHINKLIVIAKCIFTATARASLMGWLA
jgi:hypothetical protein